MKFHPVLVAYLKAVMLLAILLGISLSLKEYLPQPLRNNVPHADSLTNGNPTFYFLGTSRTQGSISTSLLKARLPDFNFVNLAIPNNSFLYSCQEAENLLKDGSARKVIFVELTSPSLSPPDSHHLLLTAGEVRAVVGQHLSIQRSLGDIGELLFYSLGIRNEIKRFAYPRLGIPVWTLGDAPFRGKLQNSMPAVLTSASFLEATRVSPRVMTFYLQRIRHLEALAKRNGSRVVVMIPLAIPSRSEREIDLAVFRQLSGEQKWVYPQEFLDTMNNPDYFADPSHMNEQGSRVYTIELMRFIGRRFNTIQIE